MKLVHSLLACMVLFAGGLAGTAYAIDTTTLPNDALQERYEHLTQQIRCMKCQNNSIADSPSELASDLRRDVKEQLIEGKSDEDIRSVMVARYGEVILFSPPFNSATAWVWIAPGLALVGGIVVGVVIVRRRAALVTTDDSPVEGEEINQ
jgi:cytochrome c-type biogenesis protein CcmH